jgi:hypothetical protein
MRTATAIARAKYRAHRDAALHRGIPFLLSFGQWWSIWQRSGHWDERGKRRGQYQMARFADQGPYELGNVRVCTVTENHQEQQNIGRPWVPARSRLRRAALAERNRRRWAMLGDLTEQQVQTAIAVAMRALR